jgi:transposase-like protein
MSILSKPYFHDEAAAFAHLEAVLWPNGPVCPHCGVIDNAYALKGVRTKPSKKNPEGVERHGLWKCADCRKQFTVRVGTVFEISHIPLPKWLQAVYLMSCSKKGVSAHQLHRILEITYKAAWFMAHRIREAMRDGSLAPMGGAGKIVETGETYFGDKAVVTKRTRKDKSGLASKRAVLALVERGGKVRSFHVEQMQQADVQDIVRGNVDRASHLFTDKSRLHLHEGSQFASHETVKHAAGEYVRYEENGPVHTNTVENVFSVFKRGMKGVYQHCSEKHLHRYLAEFDFRYNRRSAFGIEDQERAQTALECIKGKRLYYRQPPQ